MVDEGGCTGRERLAWLATVGPLSIFRWSVSFRPTVDRPLEILFRLRSNWLSVVGAQWADHAAFRDFCFSTSLNLRVKKLDRIRFQQHLLPDSHFVVGCDFFVNVLGGLSGDRLDAIDPGLAARIASLATRHDEFLAL